LPDELTISSGLALTGAANQVGTASWTISGIADIDPAKTYRIRVTVSDEDGGVATQKSVIDIDQEDARATYTGVLYASTPSISNPTTTIQLRATIEDITAVSPGSDANAGLITKATVTFVDRDTGTVIASNVPVTLLDPADPKTGVALYNWTVTLPNNVISQSYTIGVIVDGFYTRNSSADDTVVTVSLPQNGSLTGGGYLINQSSAGTYAGGVGERTNFGFNVKFNKQLTNLQGHANIIVRHDGQVYQIKTNAMNSLAVTQVTPGVYDATFTSKANLTDITDPLAPVSLGGNLDLIVTLRDAGEPGTADQIGITLWRNSTLLFSSNWTGTQTVKQLLDGGNLQVHKSATLLAEGGALAEDGTLPWLTEAQLAPIVEAAKVRWVASGLTIEQAAALAAVEFKVANLDGATLGQTEGGRTVWIDGTAAGYGWFIDSTLQDNAEFHFVQGLSQWVADGHSSAFGQIDLLTTVMHELGHVLGFDDQQAGRPTIVTLMTETLGEGVRRLPDVGLSGFSSLSGAGSSFGPNVSALSSQHLAQAISYQQTRTAQPPVTPPVIEWADEDSIATPASASLGGVKMKSSWLSKFLSATGVKQDRAAAHDFEVLLPGKNKKS
jgi:hypothetical protein